MPLRPQTVLIAGASYPLRIIIKTLIMITSVFSKKKVLDRIKFVSSEEKKPWIVSPKQVHPYFWVVVVGGGGYKNTKHQQDIVSWTKERLDHFPVPHI